MHHSLRFTGDTDRDFPLSLLESTQQRNCDKRHWLMNFTKMSFNHEPDCLVLTSKSQTSFFIICMEKLEGHLKHKWSYQSCHIRLIVNWLESNLNAMMRFSIVLLHFCAAGRQMIPKRKSATCQDDQGMCTVKEECVYNGAYNCACKKGYELVNSSCEDIDECSYGIHACHPSADCTNINGSYYCTCKQGMELNGIKCEGMCPMISYG